MAGSFPGCALSRGRPAWGRVAGGRDGARPGAGGGAMRAVALEEYGSPDDLEVREVDEPKVGPDTVLVQVEAASINPVDYKVVQGLLDGRFPALWPLVV